MKIVTPWRLMAHRRLVHAQEPGSCHQRTADRDHLLLAARQGAGELLEALLDARKQREDARQILVEFGSAAPRIGAHFEIFVDRHAWEQAPRFQHRRDAAAHPFGGANAFQRMAVVKDLAAGRRDGSHDCLHRRRLARGVAAQQANDLARRDPVIDAFQDVQVAVMRINPAKFEQWVLPLRPWGRRGSG
jgi:hypothetical protein